MKKIFFLFFTIFFVFVSCGKKLPPPSPDRIKPEVKNIYFFEGGKIRIDLSEEVSKVDSIQIKYEDTILKQKFYLNKNSILVDYDFNRKISGVYIFSLTDLNNNKKDFLNLKVKGQKIKDNIPPEITRSSSLDSVITLYFSENIEKIFFKVYPENVKYTEKIDDDKISIFLNEKFLVQVIVDSVVDFSGNINRKRWENYFFTETLQEKFSLKLNTEIKNEKFLLLDVDGNIVRENISDETGTVNFLNLKRGKYTIKSTNFLEDTLLME
ncbi:MAG: Ig-like domain-containing protein [candidate division WOR-3 bacterium]